MDSIEDRLPVWRAELVRALPHDPLASTQGLVWHEGRLFESTGLIGASSLREVELDSGTVLRRLDLPAEVYGEGLALIGDEIHVISWRNQTAFVFSRDGFDLLRTRTYEGEGWGLASDGQALVMSNGSAELVWRDAQDFVVRRRLAVHAAGVPLARLNALAWVKGELWANLLPSERIARLCPASGAVLGWIDASGLYAAHAQGVPAGPMNGIAYDPDGGRLFLTGKLWPWVFEVRLIKPSGA